MLLRLVASRESVFEPRGKDKALGETLATLLGPDFKPHECEFYSHHLIYGRQCYPDGRQKRLWERIAERNGERTLGEPFDMTELESILAACRYSADALDKLVADWLDKIRLLEFVLAPAEQVFDFVLGQRGQSLNSASKELQRRWQGAFGHLDETRLSELAPALNHGLGETGPGFATWLMKLSNALRAGDFEEAMRLVLLQNEEVMQRRGGGPWATIKGDKIEVRYSDQTEEPMPAEELPHAWRNTYFLNALKIAGASVLMKGGQA
jgi:hypothetical protein